MFPFSNEDTRFYLSPLKGSARMSLSLNYLSDKALPFLGASMIQSILSQIFTAVLVAIVILLALIMLATSIGYREEIERRKIDYYCKLAMLPIIIIILLILYFIHDLSLDFLFIALFLMVMICISTDWKQVLPNNDTEESNAAI